MYSLDRQHQKDQLVILFFNEDFTKTICYLISYFFMLVDKLATLIAVVGFEDGRVLIRDIYQNHHLSTFLLLFLFGNNHSTSSRESSDTSSCDINGNIFLIIDVAYRKMITFYSALLR